MDAFAANDNDLLMPAPFLDYGGVSIQAGGLDYNLSYGPEVGNTIGFVEASLATGSNGTPSIFPLTAVPEPLTLDLFGTGLGSAALGESSVQRTSVLIS